LPALLKGQGIAIHLVAAHNNLANIARLTDADRRVPLHKNEIGR
jgi:hypothetical protein